MFSLVLEFWIWQFLGRLHPLVVHFPIALLMIAFGMEFLVSRARVMELRNGIDILLKTGAISAIIAALFGWLLKSQDEYGGNTLTIHLWSGMITAILSFLTAGFHHRALRHGEPTTFKSYRIALAVTVIGVTITGHFGASLTHGGDYLSSALPWNQSESNFDIALINNGTDNAITEQQMSDLNLEVRSIFAHNCYRCHSAQKTKAELRLDTREFVMKGGESGPILRAGHPEKSEIIRRLLLPRDDEESMPPEGKTLSGKEIRTLQLWIKLGATWPEGASQKSVYRVAKLEPRNPAVPSDPGGLDNPVDRFVDVYFKEKKIEWPTIVADRVFVRRAFLDIIGLLPPPERVESFINNKHPDKRDKLVDELLARNDDYAQHWLTFWNDALRNDYTGTGYIDGGRSTITDWLYRSLQSNKPYDVFVKELISPDKSSEGFIRGIKWRGTVNASQRPEMQAAQNISQIFLGLNLKCTSCHDSFISDWKLKDAYAFANIFSDTTLEINRCDKPTGKYAGTKFIFVELGTIDSTMTVEEKLKQLSAYLTAPKNGRLYRTIVNRMWAQMMGRGIVEPVDLMDNLPWSQDLLDWLASDFVANGNDLKALIRKIATSRTYQMPSVAIKDENELIASDYVFKGMHRRRLSAEQFTDAVSRIVYPIYPDSVKVFSPTGESKQRNTQTPYARASLVKNDPYLTALGRPNRENVSTSRSTQANLLQALELTNGQVFNKALAAGAKQWKGKHSLSEEIVEEVYQYALGRPPEENELKAAVNMMGSEPSEESIEDLLWAVMLIPEFQLIY